ncbi:MAG: hypothetical protein KJO98_01610 [Rhodothermia bacterium]|nr:hypothetical protein [Rhodothermia bacterium]
MQRLHERAIAGDEEAKAGVMLWVFQTAREYYASKAVEGGSISDYEAQELTSQFVINFEMCFRGVRSLTHYTRRGLKCNLVRYLARRSFRTVSLHELDLATLQAATEDLKLEPWMQWDDRALRLYMAVCTEYREQSEETIRLIEAKIKDPDIPYSVLSKEFGITESAARMRVHRFFQKVRRRLEESDYLSWADSRGNRRER